MVDRCNLCCWHRENISLNDSLQINAKKFFHFSNVDIPTGYKAIQIFFKGVSTNPILIQDGSGNCFVVLENWAEVNSLKTATVEWIINKSSIQGVSCARADASTYRIKITYKSTTAPGACLSLDGMCTLLYQQYADQ